MSQRWRFDLEYDGTDFWGWQVQPERRTVQGVVEAALAQLAGAPVGVVGAGRTDRGVHATQQVAHADLTVELPACKLRRALASLLPADVRVRAARRVPDTFHARYSATRRHYVYLVVAKPDVFRTRYAWHRGQVADVERMRQAAVALVGEHDFRPFAVGESPGNGRCELVRLRVVAGGCGTRLSVSANRFLTRMVRMIAGALWEVGVGRAPVAAVAAQLAGDVRRRPPAAPARGLYLAGVSYGDFESVTKESR